LDKFYSLASGENSDCLVSVVRFRFSVLSLIAKRLHHNRASINGFKQVARGGDTFGFAIARGIALSGDFQEAVLRVDLEALNTGIAFSAESVSQA
jgi:hypothetical protein